MEPIGTNKVKRTQLYGFELPVLTIAYGISFKVILDFVRKLTNVRGRVIAL